MPPLRGLCAFLLIHCGAAAATFPDYPFKPANEYTIHAENSGIRVACLALAEEKEQRTWFGLNLGSRNYLPVAVVVENTGVDDSFILRIDNIRATVGTGKPQKQRTSPPGVGSSKVLRAATFAPLPYGLGADLALTRLKDISYNLVLKQLRNTTVSPGSSAQGFLLLPVRGAKPQSGNIHLVFPFEVSGKGTTVSVDVDF